MFVDFNILNQLGSPSINSNTFANRPAAGQIGRLFVSTDTFEIYRDNGTTWDLIGGPGSSTITGTGTATQVAYFTSSQAIGSSSNLYWDNTNIRLGIGTSTPGTRLDIHGTGIMQHINATGATANSLMAFQRTGTNVWRLGDQYNGGSNFFELHNTALANNAIQIDAATNKSIFTSIENYVSGLARANYFDYTLNLPNGTTISSPNAVTTLGATLNLNIAGSATLPNGARSGMDVFNGVNFTSAGTFTINQASTIRAFSNLTSGWAFNGSAIGTITHLAGMRVLFPTNSGTAINVTTNYGLLINDQTANTGTITYTNRWGIYQEGASDLNYMAANLLLGSTVNTGDKLQVTGTATISSSITANSIIKSGGTSSQYLMADGSTSTLTNPVTGAGTTNYIPKFTSSSAIGNSLLTDNAIELRYTGADGFRVQGITDGFLSVYGTANNYLQFIDGGGASGYIRYNHTSDFMSFQVAGSERMRLDASGNLGLGTSSPGAKLNVVSSYSSGALTTSLKLATVGGYNSGSGTSIDFGQDQGVYSTWLTGRIGSPRTGDNWGGSLDFYTNDNSSATALVQRMRLDASGNLGLGVTPSAWLSSLNALQIGAAHLFGQTTGTGTVSFGNNVYLNSTPAYIYQYNGKATRYSQYDGQHEWYTAPSGTAGNAISFTQAMTLAANGNLLIGTTTDAGQKLQVSGNALLEKNGNSQQSINLKNTTAGTSSIVSLTLTSDTTATIAEIGKVSSLYSAYKIIGISDTYIYNGTSGDIGLLNDNASGTIKMAAGGNSSAQFTLTSSGNVETTGSIKTAAPTTGTAAAWKLGSVVAAAVALDATKYIEVEVGGVFYKLAIVV